MRQLPVAGCFPGFLLLALFGVSTSASAQTVTGVVQEQESGEALSTVTVALLDEDGDVVRETHTDRRGRFEVTAPRSGRYGLRAERLGAEPVEVASFELGDGEQVERTLSMEPEPIGLDGLDVVVEALTPVEEAARRSGRRRDILAGEELAEAERFGGGVVDVIRRWPGVDVTEGSYAASTPPVGSVCVELRRRIQGLTPSLEDDCAMPLVVIDGHRVPTGEAGSLLASLRVSDFESIELLNERQAQQEYGLSAHGGAIGASLPGVGPLPGPGPRCRRRRGGPGKRGVTPSGVPAPVRRRPSPARSQLIVISRARAQTPPQSGTSRPSSSPSFPVRTRRTVRGAPFAVG